MSKPVKPTARVAPAAATEPPSVTVTEMSEAEVAEMLAELPKIPAALPPPENLPGGLGGAARALLASQARPIPGCIVMVRIAPDVVRPALVVRTLDAPDGGTFCNVHVFFDGSNDDMYRQHRWPSYHGEWMTGLAQGDGVGQWSWPVRVGP